MIIYGHVPVCFATKIYLFTQKMEVERSLMKIHLCEGYTPLGEDFVENWVVDEKI
jgi:hypothetical protein